MNPYSEKLRDPRWQRKRLEIMQRDGWACLECGCATKTLHVHHERYIAGTEPWDYPDELLRTLCMDCHASEHSPMRCGKEVLEFMGHVMSNRLTMRDLSKYPTAITNIEREAIGELRFILITGGTLAECIAAIEASKYAREFNAAASMVLRQQAE